MTVSFLGRKSTSMHPSAFQKTVPIIFPASGMVVAVFFGDAV
jgi:hypothetical protein